MQSAMASQGHFTALPDANTAGSRHLQAYREVKFLGKGAFAEVYLIVSCTAAYRRVP